MENGFPLVACGLEQSEHGSHPARVHAHVYLRMEVRGSFFANNAAHGQIRASQLEWEGLKPHIRPTTVVRRSHGNIHKAVIQGYYYVTGPKKSQLMARGSAELYRDSHVKLWTL